MRSEILSIEHQDLLSPRLKAVRTALSEYTFANLYLFRKNYEYEFARSLTKEGQGTAEMK
jgi:hypothetical protein